MTTTEAIALLREQGYRVTAPRTARAPKRLTGRKHRDCADHQRMSGYASPVCIMTRQDPEQVLSFARECLHIAATAGDVLNAARQRDYGSRAEQVAA